MILYSKIYIIIREQIKNIVFRALNCCKFHIRKNLLMIMKNDNYFKFNNL